MNEEQNNARLVIGRTSTHDDHVVFVKVVALPGLANLPGNTVREPEWKLSALAVPMAKDEHDGHGEYRFQTAVLKTRDEGGPEGHGGAARGGQVHGRCVNAELEGAEDLEGGD